MKKKGLSIRQALILFVFIILMSSTLITSAFYLLMVQWEWTRPLMYSRIVTILWVAGFSVIVGMVIASRLSKYFLWPVKQLTEANEKVAKGDFSVRVPESSLGRTNNLMHSFNRMTKELESMQVFRDDFIHVFTHEFKTPIVSIQGFARQLMRDDISEEDRREYARIIVEETQRLGSLSTNVMRLGRLETQDCVSDRTEYRLDEQIRSCILLLQKDWTEKRLDLDIDLESVVYNGNYDLMSEVWLNLLSNAIKFTGEGGSITVRLFRQADSAVVKIRDTGIGMSQETLDHMFEKYFRGDNMQSFEGIGLGLALVNRIISISNGEISAVSKENEGTEFIVKLKLGE